MQRRLLIDFKGILWKEGNCDWIGMLVLIRRALDLLPENHPDLLNDRDPLLEDDLLLQQTEDDQRLHARDLEVLQLTEVLPLRNERRLTNHKMIERVVCSILNQGVLIVSNSISLDRIKQLEDF